MYVNDNGIILSKVSEIDRREGNRKKDIRGLESSGTRYEKPVYKKKIKI